MSNYKEYYKDPESGRWVKRTVRQMKKLTARPKRARAEPKVAPKAPVVPTPCDPLVDRELVTEYLKLDPKSPTGLVWAKPNHDKPWLVSFRAAGRGAGNIRDNRVNIFGNRIETLRAVYMLQRGTAIGTTSPRDGTRLHFVRNKLNGQVYTMDDAEYKARVYGGHTGRGKLHV